MPASAQTAAAQPALDAQVQKLAVEATPAASLPGVRVPVRMGHLDPRLRLARCRLVQPSRTRAVAGPGTRGWPDPDVKSPKVQRPATDSPRMSEKPAIPASTLIGPASGAPA